MVVTQDHRLGLRVGVFILSDLIGKYRTPNVPVIELAITAKMSAKNAVELSAKIPMH